MDKRRELYAYTREQAMAARDRLAVELAHLQHVLKPRVKADLFGLLEYLRPAPDPHPADVAKLARLVAKELRKRGIWAFADNAILHISRRRPIGIRVPCAAWTIEHKQYALYAPDFDNLGPRAIADVIQAEEARKAQEWAGDE